MTLEVEEPLTVTAELQRQPETGKLLLRLINYNADRTPHGREHSGAAAEAGGSEGACRAFSR